MLLLLLFLVAQGDALAVGPQAGDPDPSPRLDDAAHIRQHAALIDLYAVRSHAMPPGNVTDITLDERAQLAGWVASGAK